MTHSYSGWSTILAGTLACAIAPIATSQPEYTGFQLHARSNFSGAYNLPNGAFFSSDSAFLNDHAPFEPPEVVVKIGVISGTDEQGVWYGSGGAGSIVYQSASGAFVSSPSINNNGLIIWEETFRPNAGLYFYDTTTGSDGLYSNLPFGADNWTAARVIDDGRVGFRAKFGFSGRAYMTYNPDSNSTTTYIADADLDPKSPYSYLFTPSFNQAGEIAGKVRLGDAGQFGEEQPDQIRLFDADGSSISIAQDQDSNPASMFESFDNSVSLSDDGHVAFTATLPNGSRGVYLYYGIPGEYLEIANTATNSEISEIEFFAPSMTDRLSVVFRAVDADGLQAIFVGDGFNLQRLIGEHDLIETDLGTARIDQNDDSPVFGGGPIGNRFGDVVFKATLTPPDNNQIEWGTGLFVARARRPMDLQVGNLRVGQQASFDVRNATPGRTVFVAWGRQVGQTFVAELNVTLDIRNPKLAGSARADGNGFASFTRRVPDVPTPFDVLFQSCELNNTSALLRTQIIE